MSSLSKELHVQIVTIDYHFIIRKVSLNVKETVGREKTERAYFSKKQKFKNGEENNEELQAFSFEMLSAYNVIIKSTLALGIPLHIWEQSIVLMIEKEKNNHRINRLRVINIYEVDYNLILKYFWPHQTTQYVERNNLLGDNQWGEIPL